MKHAVSIVAALMALAALNVHAASPKPSGFLSDYDRLVEGEYLEAYWVDLGQIEPASAPNIQVGAIETAGIKDHKGVSVADSVGWLQQDLLARQIFSDDASARYRLDLAITHMDPGSAAKRILAGEFGAGHAQLQIEGKLVDTVSGEVIAEFAERRRSSGAIGVRDPAGDAGPHIIEHLVELISDDVTNERVAVLTMRSGS